MRVLYSTHIIQMHFTHIYIAYFAVDIVSQQQKKKCHNYTLSSPGGGTTFLFVVVRVVVYLIGTAEAV